MCIFIRLSVLCLFFKRGYIKRLGMVEYSFFTPFMVIFRESAFFFFFFQESWSGLNFKSFWIDIEVNKPKRIYIFH